MKRLGFVVVLTLTLSSPAFAITELGKLWKEHYVTDKSPEAFATAVKKANCNVCHVKGKEKKEVNNEYGNSLKDLVDAEDIKKRLKTEPEKVKQEVIEHFKKVEATKAKDGKTFGDRIKAGELPATDAEI